MKSIYIQKRKERKQARLNEIINKFDDGLSNYTNNEENRL